MRTVKFTLYRMTIVLSILREFEVFRDDLLHSYYYSQCAYVSRRIYSTEKKIG
jgi:hypothetical protein